MFIVVSPIHEQKCRFPKWRNNMNDQIVKYISGLSFENISDDRMPVLEELISYIEDALENQPEVKLNFICTHNSRRSQFSQLWAQAAADYCKVNASCYSGGVEVTAFNETAVNTLRNVGFEITKSGEENPRYLVNNIGGGLTMFSKTFEDESSPLEDFTAVMTCSHADENCPVIPGADARIPLRYEDPKSSDGTPEEQAVYAATSEEIATELLYVFTEVKERRS